MLFKLSNSKYNNFILFVNEVFTKSFSFILFWFLGIRLIDKELSDFFLEMPFIFLFSTVLSFGISAFFLDQKKIDQKREFQSNISFALSLVLVINLLLAFISMLLFYFNFISTNQLIVYLVTTTLNINSNLSEYFFALKKYWMMAITSILPKLLFFILLIIFDQFFIINKNFIYILIIFVNILCSHHIIYNINLKFKINKIFRFFQFSWILTLQYFLTFLAYVSFRYFINYSNDSDYLIEFSVLQTYMGFFALLVSVSNRLIIHNLYESLVKNSVNNSLKIKFTFFNKLFFLVSFFYLNVVIYYLNNKLNFEVDLPLFCGIFFIIIASLLNFVSQYFKTIIIFNRNFSFLLYVNLFSSFLTLSLSYLSLVLKINLLYPLSIVFVNLFIFILYRTQIDFSFFKKLISQKFIYIMFLFIFTFIITEYLIYKFNFYIIPINLVIFILIGLDFVSFLKKNKKIN